MSAKSVDRRRRAKKLSTRALGTAAVSSIGAAVAAGAVAAPADAARMNFSQTFARNVCLKPKQNYFHVASSTTAGDPTHSFRLYVDGYGIGTCGNSGATGFGAACVDWAAGIPPSGWGVASGYRVCAPEANDGAYANYYFGNNVSPPEKEIVTGVVRNDGTYDRHDHRYSAYEAAYS